MVIIKMLRTTQDNVFIGDRQYTVTQPAADAMIKNGDAVFVEKLPDPVPEKKAPAAPAKTKTKAKEKKAVPSASLQHFQLDQPRDTFPKNAQKKAPAWPPNTHVSKKRPASKKKR